MSSQRGNSKNEVTFINNNKIRFLLQYDHATI